MCTSNINKEVFVTHNFPFSPTPEERWEKRDREGGGTKIYIEEIVSSLTEMFL